MTEFRTNAARYFDAFRKKTGKLDFETLAEHNELHFADKGKEFYLDTEASFDPKTFDKWDKRDEGGLNVGDDAPNCKVQILPDFDEKDDAKVEYKYIFDFCRNENMDRPLVLNFGSFS